MEHVVVASHVGRLLAEHWGECHVFEGGATGVAMPEAAKVKGSNKPVFFRVQRKHCVAFKCGQTTLEGAFTAIRVYQAAGSLVTTECAQTQQQLQGCIIHVACHPDFADMLRGWVHLFLPQSPSLDAAVEEYRALSMLYRRNACERGVVSLHIELSSSFGEAGRPLLNEKPDSSKNHCTQVSVTTEDTRESASKLLESGGGTLYVVLWRLRGLRVQGATLSNCIGTSCSIGCRIWRT